MTTEDLVNSVKIAFGIFMNNKLLGMPILFWFVLIALFGLLGVFIKGKK